MRERSMKKEQQDERTRCIVSGQIDLLFQSFNLYHSVFSDQWLVVIINRYGELVKIGNKKYEIRNKKVIPEHHFLIPYFLLELDISFN